MPSVLRVKCQLFTGSEIGLTLTVLYEVILVILWSNDFEYSLEQICVRFTILTSQVTWCCSIEFLEAILARPGLQFIALITVDFTVTI